MFNAHDDEAFERFQSGAELCVTHLVVLHAGELLDEGAQGFSFSLRLFPWSQLGSVCLENKYRVSLTSSTCTLTHTR